jgi:hypothetical protein
VRAGTKSRPVTPDIMKRAMKILKEEPTHSFDTAIDEAYHRAMGGKPRAAPAAEEAMPDKNKAAPATYMREAEKDLPPGYGIAANEKGELAVLDRAGKPIARAGNSTRASVDWLVNKGRDHADRTNDWEPRTAESKPVAEKPVSGKAESKEAPPNESARGCARR